MTSRTPGLLALGLAVGTFAAAPAFASRRPVRDPHRQQRRRGRGHQFPVSLQQHLEGHRADHRRQGREDAADQQRRKEPFYIAEGRAFDLFNLNPLGVEVGGNNSDLEGKNVSTLAVELPISCLTAGTDPVIGAFTTASLRQGSLLDGSPARRTDPPARCGGPRYRPAAGGGTRIASCSAPSSSRCGQGLRRTRNSPSAATVL
jgi:hypothetical protein